MFKTKIYLFAVKYKGEYIQVEGISDGYNRVQICLSPELQKISEKVPCENQSLGTIGEQEAKDLCGKYGDFEVSIIEKEIEL